MAVMLQRFDAELVLVLPRLVWLWFLTASDDSSALLRLFLPQRFPANAADAELQALVASCDGMDVSIPSRVEMALACPINVWGVARSGAI